MSFTQFDVWGKRPERHSTPEILGTRCDGCEFLSCIEREKARVHRWSYYCEKLTKRMTCKQLSSIKAKDCPVHRLIRRRKK